MKIIKSRVGWSIIEGDSHISQWVEDSGKLAHDDFLIPLCTSHMNPGDCVIDCGANIGSHTSEYSKKVGETGVVVAIEPGKLAFECLLANSALFAHKNIFPLRAALSEFDGQTVEHFPIANIGASECIHVPDDERVKDKFYLLTCTLDFVASQIQRPVRFIKLDIEGWEAKALIGASKILHDHQPELIIEINQGALEKQGDTPQDIFDILTVHKYVWTICQPDCKVTDAQYDILAIPSRNIPLQ